MKNTSKLNPFVLENWKTRLGKKKTMAAKMRSCLIKAILPTILLLYMNTSWATGPLDGAASDYYDHTLIPILIKEKLCDSEQDCRNHEYFFYTSWTSISFLVYGITDEKIVRKIFMSMLNSGLRIEGITFWPSRYHKGSIFERPILNYIDHTGSK